MDSPLAAWATPRLERLETLLADLFDDAAPPVLRSALRYPLATGGKRIRPLLVVAAGESNGQDATDALWKAAVAFELVHTYSLVHDDLPCMDDDDLRRGQPTVHKAFGEGPAVLVGDALLTHAFQVMAETGQAALVGELAAAAGYRGMIGGQADDIEMGGPVRDVAALERLHAKKTGALIRGAVRCGALLGGADLDALTRYGEAVGLAFQLADDVLDRAEADEDDGPPSFVRLLGAEETRRRAQELARRAEAHVAGLLRPEPLVALARFTVERTV